MTIEGKRSFQPECLKAAGTAVDSEQSRIIFVSGGAFVCFNPTARRGGGGLFPSRQESGRPIIVGSAAGARNGN